MAASQPALYGADLAHVHDVAFGAWARDAAPFVLARLREAGIEDGLVVCGSTSARRWSTGSSRPASP